MDSPGSQRSGLRYALRVVLKLCVLGVLIYEGIILVRVVRLQHHNPDTTAFMDLRRDTLAAHGRPFRKQMIWVPYGQISPNLHRAVVVEEDPRFWQHHGYDTSAMWEALKTDLKKGRLYSGASTIDQQLAKNLFLSPSKNPLRKVQEIIIALEMETFLGKRRILELYLNVIEWGDGVYGAEAAARHYFQESAAELTPEQAAYLTAIIPGPRGVFNPARHPDRVQRRADEILEKTRRFQ